MNAFLITFAALCLAGAALLFLLWFADHAVTVANNIVTVGYRVAEMKEDLEDRRVEREKR